jgi:hypothetical protein
VLKPEFKPESGQARVIKMAPPQRMLAALKKMGIKTP